MVPKEALLRKLEPYLVPAIVALVGVAAFGLGRLSVMAGEGPRLVIEQSAESAAATEAFAADAGAPAGEAKGGLSGNYVASKSGTKYYLPDCSGVSRIKESNKVWFTTAQEAQAAGYAPAANCPGL